VRRSEKTIADRAEINSIIRHSQVFRLGLSDRGQPYIVPLCFGYDGAALYFHCATEGRKLEILRQNNRVCFEFDNAEGMVEGEQACQWSMRYRSVIGFGTAHEIKEASEKRNALALLMAQYSERMFSFPEPMVNRVVVIKVEIESLTGKQSAGPG